jgi:hypothetical protein
MNLKKLDKVFSEYIRLRDSDENGICTCITCGVMHHWKNMDNGHFIKRQHMLLRFSEINCNAQCRKCNWLGQGEDYKYTIALQKKYGDGIVEKLLIMKKIPMKFTQFEIDELEKYYKNKLKQLQEEKK